MESDARTQLPHGVHSDDRDPARSPGRKAPGRDSDVDNPQANSDVDNPQANSDVDNPQATTDVDHPQANRAASPGCSHLPFWAPGSGHYGDTMGQNTRLMVNSCTPLVLDAVDSMPAHRHGVFTIADYGANDGYTSMELLASLVRAVRRKQGECVPIQVIYEDQEQNDFNSLFARLSSSEGLTSQFSNVFPFATNVNFYRQCVPDHFCDVILTSFASHWVESAGATFRRALFHDSPGVTQQELDQYLAKAHRDRVKFLLLRAKELKPGGLLIDITVGRADDHHPQSDAATHNGQNGHSAVDRSDHPQSDASTHNGQNGQRAEQSEEDEEGRVSALGTSNRDTMLYLEKVWSQLAADGLIEEDEYAGCTFATCCRSKQEILAPFRDPGSPVVKAGLSLVHCDQVTHANPAKDLWRHTLAQQGLDDRDGFATRVTDCARAFSYSTFEGSLSPGRSPKQKAAILRELFQRYQALVAGTHPDRFQCEYILYRLVARKC